MGGEVDVCLDSWTYSLVSFYFLYNADAKYVRETQITPALDRFNESLLVTISHTSR